jgi:hypothetical protein
MFVSQPTLSYQQLYRMVAKALYRTHVEGKLKGEIIKDPSRWAGKQGGPAGPAAAPGRSRCPWPLPRLRRSLHQLEQDLQQGARAPAHQPIAWRVHAAEQAKPQACQQCRPLQRSQLCRATGPSPAHMWLPCRPAPAGESPAAYLCAAGTSSWTPRWRRR